MTPIQILTRAATALCIGAVAGCVAPQPLVYQQPYAPQQQAPFVAVPGPGKSAALFRQDDAYCRTPQALTPQPIRPGTQAGQAVVAEPGVPPLDTSRMTPGVVYLQCMETRNNLIEPLQVSAPAPAVYGYLQPYPVYVGPWYGYGYPWYYGSIGFGYGYGFGGYGYRGYGWRGGWGGYRGGWGGGYGGGFRGGYGGGWGGGGGFRGGGGWGGRR